MEYTEIIYLINQTDNYDSIGNNIPVESQTKIYAKEDYVRTNEFYNAVANGMYPTAELRIKKLNYSGQTELIWNNIRYFVIRTLPVGTRDLILIIEKKIGVN